MVVECAHYVRGSRQGDDPASLDDAAARPRSGSSFVWIELHEPEADVMDELRRRFDLHELAVEDAARAHQRPKVEAYDDFHFIVFRTAAYDDERGTVVFGEVEIFIGRGYVIAVRHGLAADLRPVRERLERRPELLKSGPAAVVWGILDAVVDDYQPVVEGLDRDIDDVERTIFTEGRDATERIYDLRQEVSNVHRTVHPLLEPLAAIERGAFAGMDPALLRYFRDVRDHLRRVDEEVAAHRDELQTALDANVSLISLRQNQIAARQNEVVKQLTLMASVFLPLTFVTGFFGQNFGWLTGHIDSFGAFLALGIGGVAVACVAVYALFRRERFF